MLARHAGVSGLLPLHRLFRGVACGRAHCAKAAIQRKLSVRLQGPPLGQKSWATTLPPRPRPATSQTIDSGACHPEQPNPLDHFSQGVLVALPGCPQDRLHDFGSPVKSTALSLWSTSHFLDLPSRTNEPAAGTTPGRVCILTLEPCRPGWL